MAYCWRLPLVATLKLIFLLQTAVKIKLPRSPWILDRIMIPTTTKFDAGGHNDQFNQYGYRRSCRRTSYEYRGSSSLTPTQIMKQETYYRYAEVAVQHITYILQLILLQQATYVFLRATTERWSGITSMAGAWIGCFSLLGGYEHMAK